MIECEIKMFFECEWGVNWLAFIIAWNCRNQINNRIIAHADGRMNECEWVSEGLQGRLRPPIDCQRNWVSQSGEPGERPRAGSAEMKNSHWTCIHVCMNMYLRASCPFRASTFISPHPSRAHTRLASHTPTYCQSVGQSVPIYWWCSRRRLVNLSCRQTPSTVDMQVHPRYILNIYK